MNLDKKLSLIAALYFVFGLIFATAFAIYYKWEILGFFSPGFYMVIITWPFQILGFVNDFLQYGLAGPTLR